LPRRPSDLDGTVLGQCYRILGFIGQGAMARVYLAEDLETHDAVAVKVLNNEQAKNPMARQRLLREGDSAKAISHPGVIRVLAMGEQHGGSPYLVIEYLWGESLKERLSRPGPLPLERTLWVASEAASALSAAHHAGVVHRDVKPDNIFLVGAVGQPHA